MASKLCHESKKFSLKLWPLKAMAMNSPGPLKLWPSDRLPGLLLSLGTFGDRGKAQKESTAGWAERVSIDIRARLPPCRTAIIPASTNKLAFMLPSHKNFLCKAMGPALAQHSLIEKEWHGLIEPWMLQQSMLVMGQKRTCLHPPE